MRVLWLCNVILPRIARDIGAPINNSGGWLTGLSEELLKVDKLQLAICFPDSFQQNLIRGSSGKLQYYVFPSKNESKKNDNRTYRFLEEILQSFKPDIIHIFGTEYYHTFVMTQVCKKLGVKHKIIISIQGLVSVCSKHYFASLPFKVINSFTFRDLLKWENIKSSSRNFYERGKFEIFAIQNCSHLIGRTDWDKACTEQINPNAYYHHCNEILRNQFYQYKWDLEACEKHSIFVSQSGYPIKGFHLMLDAMAEIIKRYPDAHLYTTGKNLLEWGWKARLKETYYQKYIRQLIKKYHLQKHITFLGNLEESQMCLRFLKSHIFVSPSSIENSPNSVGEAMLLGVPTISSDVGGVKNMLCHEKEGFIYPYDEPYMIAYYVGKIFDDDELALKLSQNARIHAADTHNKKKNITSILKIYREVNGGG